MRRWLVGAGAAAVVLATAAGAVANSYPWGTYQGYPVVHVFVNGTQLRPDVPAVIINGRTMVSIKYAAQAVGGTAVWNGTQFAADVTVPYSGAATDAQVYTALKAAVNAANTQGNNAWSIAQQMIAGSMGTAAQSSQATSDANDTLQAERSLGDVRVNPASKTQTQALVDTIAYLSAVNDMETTVATTAQDGSQDLTAKYQDGLVAANDAELWANTLANHVNADFTALQENQ